MIPKILKNFNVYVDGRGYAGRVEEVTLPKLTLKTEEYLGAGMSAPIEIEMGMEKLEMDLTFAEYDPTLFRLFGMTNGSSIALTIRGVMEGRGLSEPVVINVRGFFKEMDTGSWKPAEKATLKVSVALNYYKLSINDSLVIEVDPENMIKNIGEGDAFNLFRNILQI